jgi:alpha-tubulin suppressor-like RCC1 family protein
LSDIRQLALGVNHTCALQSNHEVVCWGSNAFGELGYGIKIPIGTYKPLKVGALVGKPVVEIAAGDRHSCARTEADEIWCWGSNSAGQLGTAPSPDEPNPVLSSASGRQASALALGSLHSCILANSAVYCWGSNAALVLGNEGPDSQEPVSALINGTVTEIAGSGFTHTCVRLSDESLWCWGANDFGQLGRNTVTPSELPGAVTF